MLRTDVGTPMKFLLMVVVAVSIAGCLPSTKVRKNPRDVDRGFRYYRPKPYLLLKPSVDGKGEPVNGMVDISMEMLPDFSEEYSIHVNSGLGTNKTKITFNDGWRLDKLNVDIDSKFDENVKAIAGAIPKLTSGKGEQDVDVLSVKATNVPIGYYEAVLSQGKDGKKRLYGFRYVGFMPYSSCPVESCGVESTECHSVDLYALVYENGSMLFKRIQNGSLQPVAKNTEESERSEQIPARVSSESHSSNLGFIHTGDETDTPHAI